MSPALAVLDVAGRVSQCCPLWSQTPDEKGPHSHLLDTEMCRFVSKYKHCSGAVAQWVALSPRMHQALGSIPNINQRHTQVILAQRKWKQEDHVFKMIHGYVAC